MNGEGGKHSQVLCLSYILFAVVEEHLKTLFCEAPSGIETPRCSGPAARYSRNLGPIQTSLQGNLGFQNMAVRAISS